MSSIAGPSRPVTSKARGVCKYYTDPRGCYAGDKCKFLHAVPEESAQPLLTPYDKSKRCKFYAQGYCKRGEACWFLHVDDSDVKRKEERKKSAELTGEDEDEEEDQCSICFEKPTTYGLLGGCSHIFCITCIKRWRERQNKADDMLSSGNTKRCPMCRAMTRFITPSSRFHAHGSAEKERVLAAYKESMARVDCRYFQKSLEKNKENAMCPFGKDCFYRHRKEDGTTVQLKESASVAMRKYHAPRSRMAFIPDFFLSQLGPLTYYRDEFGNERRLAQYENLFGPGRMFPNEAPPPGRSATIPEPVETSANPWAALNPTNTARTTATVQRMTRNIERTNRNMELLATALGTQGRGTDTDMGAVNAALLAMAEAAAGTRRTTEDGQSQGAGTARDGESEPMDMSARMHEVRATAASLGNGVAAWVNSVAGGESHTEAGRYEDEVMQTLEVLADQMFASISAMRANEEARVADAAQTDSALPAGGSAASSAHRRPTPIRDTSRTGAPRQTDGSDSDGSMPALHSVSNSSSSESSESDEDDESADSDVGAYAGQVRDAEVLNALFSGWARAVQEMEEGGSEDGESDMEMPPLEPVPQESAETLEALAGSNSLPRAGMGSGRFSTVVERAASGSSSSSSGASIAVLGGDVPQVVPVTLTREDTGSPPPLSRASSSSPLPPLEMVPELDVTEGSSSNSRRKSSDFTTDGRGKVISIGGNSSAGPSMPALEPSSSPPPPTAVAVDEANDADDEDEEDAPISEASPAPARKNSEFTTDGRGRVISVGSAEEEEAQAAAASNQGLFGWFGAFF